MNIYAPNNHYRSEAFFSYIMNEIDHITTKYPLSNLIVSGDFNFVFSQDNDSIGRNQSKQEIKVKNLFERACHKHSLVDSFRNLNKFGGYTWGKDNPTFLRSRLDHVFISKALVGSLLSSNVTYKLHESDHNLVTSEFSLYQIRQGPGIVRANSSLLEVSEIKNRVESELNKCLNEMPNSWNPHQKIDFFKYKTRDLLLSEGKAKSLKDKSRLALANNEYAQLKAQLDRKLEQKSKINSNSLLDIDVEIENLKDAIEINESSTKDLKEEEAKKLIFRSRAKWSEEGEKSNKYFLNLVKARQRKMQIRKITANGTTHTTQDEISKAIFNFYKNLYKKQDNIVDLDLDNEFVAGLPRLNQTDKLLLSAPLTLNELHSTLNTCKDSAPGPDGLPYEIYKHLWHIAGPLVLESWNYLVVQL